MKKNLYLNITLAFLLFIVQGHAQSITSVTTTPGAPILRGSTFTVTVQISGMPSMGNKRYAVTVNCTECNPAVSRTEELAAGNGVTLGSITISGSPTPFTTPNRAGTVAISVSAVGQNSGDGCQPCTFNAAPSLPVELAFFNGVNDHEKIQLKWKTSTELNNEKFIIETSAEGEIFQGIAEIAGAGTTTEPQNYQFTHHTPSAGVNYYRLKQVDYDGTFAYSRVLAIEAAGSQEVLAFPNPVQDKLQVQYDHSKGPGSFYLYNALGRRVNFQLDGYAGNYELQLPADLPTGTYWLKIIRAGKVQTLQVVKP